MRDAAWLKNELDTVFKKYFQDVPVTNPIEIRFGREAKYRFGSIKLLKPRGVKFLRSLKNRQPAKSVITITSMFANENVPEEVVQYTIGHELCHYAHGFSSTNKRLFKYPHHGGIVNKELARRGAEHLSHTFKKWLKSYRKQILSGKVSI